MKSTITIIFSKILKSIYSVLKYICLCLYTLTKAAFLVLSIIVPIQLIVLILQKLSTDYFNEMEDCILQINLEKLKYMIPNMTNVSVTESANLVNLLLKEDCLDYYNLVKVE